MKHSLPQKRDPYQMLRDAIGNGWQTVDNIPLAGEGDFMVLTLSGLIRRARSRHTVRTFRKADAYGPMRTTVRSVETGNYLAAIAWQPVR